MANFFTSIRYPRTKWTLPGLVHEVIIEIDYDQQYQLAELWYPVGKEFPIVVNPQITSGLPTIKDRGITVQIIHRRFKAGQDFRFIAQDFDLDEDVVQEAGRYAEKVPV